MLGKSSQICSILLAVCLVTSFVPMSALAEELPSSPSVLSAASFATGSAASGDDSTDSVAANNTSSGEATLELHADSDNTVKIEKPAADNHDDQEEEARESGDALTLIAEKQTIKRDYSQALDIKVENNSEAPKRYYLDCNNDYDDLYMNFVEGGSEGAPLTIQPGEMQTVSLSVFAQNARGNSYWIEVSAYLVDAPEAQQADGDDESNDAREADVTLELAFDCEESGGSHRADEGRCEQHHLSDRIRRNQCWQ